MSSDNPLAKREALKLSRRQTQRWMFDEAAGGVAVSGDAGSGKSVLMRQVLRRAVEEGESAVFLFDPHGDLARQVHIDALDLGESVRRRTYFFAPGDPLAPIGPLDPLSVPAAGLSPYSLANQRNVKVLHAALLILSSWGDENFDQKPLLFKWLTTVLECVQALGLPMADAVHFFDFGSDLQRRLIRSLPDEKVRREFDQLAELRYTDREQMIASTKNRLDGLFKNEVMNAHLGVSRLVGQTVDVKRLIAERAVVIVDLAPRGELHEDIQQPILANFWLGEVLHTIFATPEERRQPVLIACDELPVFRLSGPLLTRALSQIRKMKARLFMAFQGIWKFPLGKDDPLLRAMAQCGTRFYFRHDDYDDATYFGKMATLPHLNPRAVKFEYWDKEQYQAGEKVCQLVDRGFGSAYSFDEGESTASGTHAEKTWAKALGKSRGTSHGSTHTEGTKWERGESEVVTHTQQQSASETRDNHAMAQSYQRAAAHSMSVARGRTSSVGGNESSGNSREESFAESEQTSSGGSDGTSDVRTNTTNKSTSNSKSTTHKQQLVPVLDWREVLRFMEFLSFDDQELMAASVIAGLAQAEAIMQRKGYGSATVIVPRLKDEFADTPNYVAKLRSDYYARLRKLGFVYDANQLFEFRATLPAAFLTELQQQPQQPEVRPSNIPSPSDNHPGLGI